MRHEQIRPEVILACSEMQNGIEKKDKNQVLQAMTRYSAIVIDTHYNNQIVGEEAIQQLERKTLRNVAVFLTQEFPQ
jgi:hypothetical protein